MTVACDLYLVVVRSVCFRHQKRAGTSYHPSDTFTTEKPFLVINYLEKISLVSGVEGESILHPSCFLHIFVLRSSFSHTIFRRASKNNGKRSDNAQGCSWSGYASSNSTW